MTLKITGCVDCPLYNSSDKGCMHPKGRAIHILVNFRHHKPITPDNCPLKKEALIVLHEESDLIPKHDSHRCGDGHYPGIPFHP